MCFNETGSNDLIIAIGSLFVAAEVREIIKNIPPEDYPVFNAQRNASLFCSVFIFIEVILSYNCRNAEFCHS